MDGEYADEMTIIQFPNSFDLYLKDQDASSGQSRVASFTSQLAQMASYNKFSLRKYQLCSFDFEVEYAQTYKMSSDQKTSKFRSSHKVTVRNSVSGMASVSNRKYKGKVSDQCLPGNIALHINVNSDHHISTMIRDRTPGFTILSAIVLMVSLILSKSHIEKFEMIFQNRAENMNQHGQNMVSYPSQFSLTSHFMLVLTNFLIFFLFFQLSMIGVMNYMFFFVLILHFANSFCFLGHVYFLHVKIIAIDRYTNFNE